MLDEYCTECHARMNIDGVAVNGRKNSIVTVDFTCATCDTSECVTITELNRYDYEEILEFFTDNCPITD